MTSITAHRGRSAARYLHPTQRQIREALKRALQSDLPTEEAVLAEPALIHAPLQVLLTLGPQAAAELQTRCR